MGGCVRHGTTGYKDDIKAYKAIVKWELDPKGYQDGTLLGMPLQS